MDASRVTLKEESGGGAEEGALFTIDRGYSQDTHAPGQTAGHRVRHSSLLWRGGGGAENGW